MAKWVEWNENPAGRATGDCAVRAVALALGVDWETAYALIALNGFLMGDVIASNAVWGSVLRQNGFSRRSLPDSCPDCYSIGDFADENPRGVYVVGTGNHVATIKDGVIWDAWDSRNEPALYYWHKED